MTSGVGATCQPARTSSSSELTHLHDSSQHKIAILFDVGLLLIPLHAFLRISS